MVSMSFVLALNKMTFIGVTLDILVETLSLRHIVDEVAFEGAARSVGDLALTVLLVVLEGSFVVVAVG